MTQYKRYFLLVICGLLVMLLVACGNQSYIDVVKDTTFKGDTYTTGQYIDSIAGKNGKVKWNIAEQKNQPNTVLVTVDIRPSRKAKGHIVKMQYLLNTNNDYVEFGQMEIDGKVMSHLAGALQISRIIMESTRS